MGTIWERDVGRGYLDVCGFALVCSVNYWERKKGRQGLGYGYGVFSEKKEM